MAEQMKQGKTQALAAVEAAIEANLALLEKLDAFIGESRLNMRDCAQERAVKTAANNKLMSCRMLKRKIENTDQGVSAPPPAEVEAVRALVGAIEGLSFADTVDSSGLGRLKAAAAQTVELMKKVGVG